MVRLITRPFGYLAFILALLALSGAGKLLGERHELGFFSDRLAKSVWRYPEVTRRGIQMAWLAWVALFAVAISPLDPLATQWDELVLAAAALVVLWRLLVGGHRAGH